MVRTATDEGENASPLTVVLVDDHRLVRLGLASILENDGRFIVVGEASDGAEGVRVAMQTHPDAVLMDVQMPGVGGVEATRRIMLALPMTRVVGLTMLQLEFCAARMRSAGAVDCLPKEIGAPDLCAALLRACGRSAADAV